MKFPKIKWWQYLSLGSFIAGWVARALPDGVITRTEMEGLIQGILDMLGVDEIRIED